jgi:hypothetical protein
MDYFAGLDVSVKETIVIRSRSAKLRTPLRYHISPR